MQATTKKLLLPVLLTLCAAPLAIQDPVSPQPLDAPRVGLGAGLTQAQIAALSAIRVNPFDGTTLMSPAEERQLANWIGRPFDGFELAFRKTTDGATSSAFHTAVDDLGPTVTVIQLANGVVFGGYNPAGWTSLSSYNGSAEGEGFLFSFHSGKRFPYGSTDADRLVYDHPSYGPTFGGGHDFYINSTLDLQYTNFPFDYSWQGTNKAPTDAACQELTGLDRLVSSPITELEVWVLEGVL